MPFPQPVLDDIQRGKSFLSQLDADDSANMELGCVNCCVKNYDCLSSILNSLEMKIALDQYDEYAIDLYEKMLVIIGDYTIKIPPMVNAGADQSVPINETAFFNATITEGSAPIVSIQWTIVSGSGTLTGANTANVQVTGFIEGNTVLKVTVIDGNSRSDSDTAILTGITATEKVYYLFSDTNTLPTEVEILAADFVNIVPGSSYIVPVNNGEVKYVMIAERLTEPAKVRWDDTVDPDNNGTIGVNKTILPGVTVGSFRVYVTNFKTEFPNPIKLS